MASAQPSPIGASKPVRRKTRRFMASSFFSCVSGEFRRRAGPNRCGHQVFTRRSLHGVLDAVEHGAILARTPGAYKEIIDNRLFYPATLASSSGGPNNSERSPPPEFSHGNSERQRPRPSSPDSHRTNS